ncbi:abnormal spindle-like microcephaly-associated protein [Rhineura floridana]|uniref:abnormal spindle-like microcephaly-associated protein n=1 Tax=Rhineura floridana TaxID=261503 RepID=UPI002AC816B9|nr:abnormal spindle-like microcephaly-associated protein [Rhineura floridana]
MAVGREYVEAAGLREVSPGGRWRQRRRWAFKKGKEDGGYEEEGEEDGESLPVLTLSHFSRPPFLSFGTVRVGTSRLRRLALENPNAEPVRVAICRPPPASKGFTVEQHLCLLKSGERTLISITWTPLEGGKVRELITFIVNDVVKHQAVLLGVAEQSTKKKKSLWDTIKKRTPAQQSGCKKRLPIIKNVNKTFQMSGKTGKGRSPLQSCENLEVTGATISPSGDTVILLENKLFHSPTNPILQENQHVTYTPLSMRRSVTYTALGTAACDELQQDIKETCHVMPFVEAELERAHNSSSVEAQSFNTNSICTPEELKRLHFPLNHRRILSPDSFVNNSYELCEEPAMAATAPVLSPDQFLKENQIVIHPVSQVHESVSLSSSVESCMSRTIFSKQKKKMQVLTFSVEPQVSSKSLNDMHNKKCGAFQYEKFEQNVSGCRKTDQDQTRCFQKEQGKKRPVLSNTVTKSKPDRPEGKGIDTLKPKSRKCLSNAIQQCADIVPETEKLEMLPELPVIEPFSGEAKYKVKTASPGLGSTLHNRKRKSREYLEDTNSGSGEYAENFERKKILTSFMENENQSALKTLFPKSVNREKQNQKKRPGSLSQKWKTSRKTRNIVPVAQSQLTFVKPLKTGIPRHPMPFVAKNMFYDERWKEKQQRGFTWWLNFVLTPDDFTVKTDTSQVNAGSLILGTESHKSSVPRAPTKEEMSLRAYTARCKLNKLRRSACHLFTSDEMVKAIKRLEVEIEAKHLLIRRDRHLWKDIGERQKILNWLLCYDPLWLRIGLEVVYGELIALESNSDVMGLAMFILNRLLWNPDIAAEYRHPTVPNLYRDGHEEALSKFTLKKLLLLVCFLDRAKLSRIIYHDPCLFCKNAEFKSSKEILLAFSRDFLSGEGDLSRHLGFLGFPVNHVQTPLDEFDFAVTNLATDLQCGIRLVRALELLSSNWSLSKKLRVPAISRLQKMHNVKIAFQELKDHGIQLEGEHGKTIDAKDIVDRHREKTLALLWKIVFAFQVDVSLDRHQLKEEIGFLKNMHVTKVKTAALESSVPSKVRKDSSSFYSSESCSENVKLLMDWVSAVCGFYNVKVENFTVSFSDGRVLCYLIHHYHPCYVPLEAICQRTTLTVECTKSGTTVLNSSSESDGSLNLLNGTFDETITSSVLYKELLDNERRNFQLINAAVSDLGGVPAMIHHSDMSNTIPDEKVVIAFVSFLCLRLLNLSKEIRAARLIQSMWREHRLKRKLAQTMEQKINATVAIQKHWRRYLAQMKFQNIKKAKQEDAERVSSMIIQTYWRRYHARRKYLQLRHYTIIVQARIRMLLAVTAYKKVCCAALTIQRRFRALLTADADRRRYQNMKVSALVIQSAFRRWRVCKRNSKVKTEMLLQANEQAKERAAVVIQSRYRMTRDRNNYLRIRQSVIKIQALFRCLQAKYIYQRKRRCAAAIQKCYRAYRLGKTERETYLQKRAAAIFLQSVYRGMKTRLMYRQVRAACVIQIHYCAYRKQTFLRQKFLQVKKAAVCLQAAYRGYRLRKMLKCQHTAAVKIQSAFRTYAARRKYLALIQASLVIQRWYRASKIRTRFLKTKAAVTCLQAALRSWQVRKWIQGQHAAAVKIQSAFRRYTALKRFRLKRNAAQTLQQHYRAKTWGRKQQQEYVLLRSSIIQLQAAWRGSVVRKQIERKCQAAVVIQSYFRMHIKQSKFKSFKGAVVIIQRWYRAVMLARSERQEYLALKVATVKMQAIYRSVRARQRIRYMHQAAVSIQAMFKMHRSNVRYRAMKLSATIIQRRYRAFCRGRMERKNYLKLRMASLILQAAYRGMKVRQEVKNLHRSATSIQSFYRMYMQRKYFQKLIAAAKLIQWWYRSCKERNSQMCKYRQMKTSALQIQSAFRGMKARLHLKKMHVAATTIQRRFRTFLQRQSFISLKTAGVIIQRKYRAVVLSKQQREAYVRLYKAAVIMQSTFRGLLARKYVKQMQGAATVIQAAFRRHRAFTQYQAVKLASISIQQHFRAYQETKRVRGVYLKQRRSVLILQAACRGMKGRRILKEQHYAATVIQSNYRKHRQQCSYQKVQWAAKVIQIRIRANKLCKIEVQRYSSVKNAAICIQKAFRRTKARRCQQRHQAAIVLQRHFKTQRERRKYLALKAGTIVLQRRYRALILARRLAQEYVSIRAAIVCVQSFYRGFKIRKEIERVHLAARVIQAAFRMHRAKVSYQRLRGAAITIQNYYRSYLKGKNQENADLAIRKSSIMVQATYRDIRTQQGLKATHVSATLIQSLYRMHVQCKHYKLICWAAITIQSGYRGSISRKKAKEMRAARKIQSFLRIAVARRKLIQLRSAAIALQTQYHANKAIEQYQKYWAAALLIQQRYRSYLAVKHRRVAYLQTLRSICIMQATVGSFLEHRRVCRMKNITQYQVLEQSQQSFLLRFGAAAYHHLAAIRIQRAYRMHLHLKCVHLQLSSVLYIQRWYRAKLQRRKYLQYREKIIKIQRIVKRWMSCRNVAADAVQESKTQETLTNGITKFQALWRGYSWRKKTDTAETRTLRDSLVIANKESKEEKKLCNRTALAIDRLLKYKHFSYILAALKDLEVVTRLSPVCCESMAQSEAVFTIFTLIRSCNRSVPCMDVIRYSVQILLNLSKYERTTQAVYTVENSVDTLLDLLQMYRERAGDKISEKGGSIFTKTCCLFALLSKDSRRAAEIRRSPQVVTRLQSLFKLTARKHQMDAQRMLAKHKSGAYKNGHFSVPITPIRTNTVSRHRPEWVLRRDNIQEIVDPLLAIQMVMDTLGVSYY